MGVTWPLVLEQKTYRDETFRAEWVLLIPGIQRHLARLGRWIRAQIFVYEIQQQPANTFRDQQTVVGVMRLEDADELLKCGLGLKVGLQNTDVIALIEV